MENSRRLSAPLGAALLPCAALLAPALAATPASEGPESERRAVEQVARQWIRASDTADLDARMRLYTPDADVVLHGQLLLRGQHAFRAYFTPRVGRGRVEFLLDVDRDPPDIAFPAPPSAR